MSKSRPFSIYLLKTGFDKSNSLKDDSRLDDSIQADGLPPGATLYVLDNPPHPPWWKDYFKISKDLTQVTKGALIFLPVDERCFVISFGHVYHYLKDTCYEYDFGLRVTLNSVTPKFKSADTVDPGSSKRQRTQFPIESDLTYFDFDRDSTIVKKLTGKVKEEYRDLFKQATGASNLKINVNVPPADLTNICQRLLTIYQSEDYKRTFPSIQNIEPVKDPDIIVKLNDKLLVALKNKEVTLSLTVPDIINYSDNIYACFSGAGGGTLHDDVSMAHYYDYLEENGVDLQSLDVNILEDHSLDLTDENGYTRESFNIFKCILFDAALDNDSHVYHLCEGDWYKVEKDYVNKMKAFLDPHFEDISMLAYNHGKEGAYNQAVAANDRVYICLDEKNISPDGNTPVEPCDLYRALNNKAHFYHVKISTRSSHLSHLFNQGVNSIELIKLEDEARNKLKGLIRDDLNGNNEDAYLAPIDEGKHKVIFAVITHKNKANKSDNFPLFSRISLMRSIKALRLMSVEAVYCFVNDASVKAAGRKKPRKSKKGSEE